MSDFHRFTRESVNVMREVYTWQVYFFNHEQLKLSWVYCYGICKTHISGIYLTSHLSQNMVCISTKQHPSEWMGGCLVVCSQYLDPHLTKNVIAITSRCVLIEVFRAGVLNRGEISPMGGILGIQGGK